MSAPNSLTRIRRSPRSGTKPSARSWASLTAAGQSAAMPRSTGRTRHSRAPARNTTAWFATARARARSFAIAWPLVSPPTSTPAMRTPAAIRSEAPANENPTSSPPATATAPSASRRRASSRRAKARRRRASLTALEPASTRKARSLSAPLPDSCDALEGKKLDPAAHVQLDPGDVAGQVGAEERDRVCDFLRLAGSAQRSPADHSLVHLWVAEGERLGGDHARHDRVDRDAVPRPFERGRPRQSEQTGFGGRVARLAETAERARDRRHVHDPAPTSFDHPRPHRLRAVEGAGQVHAQVARPELRRLVGQLAQMVERGGVVDKDVDRAELLRHPPHRFVDLLAGGDVTAERKRPLPNGFDLRDGRLGVDEALRPCRLRQRPIGLGRLARVGLELDVGDRDVSARSR